MHEHDAELQANEVRHIVASFDNVGRFEDAIELLEQFGFRRSHISMIASHGTVKTRLSGVYKPAETPHADGRLPQVRFVDRHDIVEGRSLAIGAPASLRCTAEGRPVVATGGALAFAACIAAAGMPAEDEFGVILARVIEKRHAALLEREIAAGNMLLGVDTRDVHEADYATYLLQKAGGHHVTAHTIAQYWPSHRRGLDGFDPHPYSGRRPDAGAWAAA